MAEEISELVVKMSPEGLSETTEGLETVQDTTEDTAGVMEEQADEADSFADKFQGSMQVAVSALAIASTGLLSQVPVLGEAMSGLFALVESIAFQMDKVLRPVISPIANALFRLSGIVGDMNGPLGTLVGIVGSLAAAFGGLVIVGKITGAFSGLAVASGALTSVLTVVAAALTALAGVLGLPVAAVAALVAGIGLLVAGLATDFLGIRTKVVNALQTFFDWTMQLGDAFLDLLGAVKEGLGGAANFIVDTIANIDPVQLGEDILGGIATGLGKLAEFLADGAVAIGSFIVDKITNTDWVQVGADIIGAIAAGIERAVSVGADLVIALAKFSDNIIDATLDAFGDVAEAVTTAFKQAWNNSIGGTSLPRVELSTNILGKDIGGEIGGQTIIPKLESGGLIEGDGLAFLHAGEAVLPESDIDRDGLDTAQFATPRRGKEVTELDGKVVAERTAIRQRGTSARRNIDG